MARWGRSLRRKSRPDLVQRLYVVVFVLFLLAFGWGLYRAIGYAYESPDFQVSGITVQGLLRLSEGEVLARAGFTAGANLLRLDLDAMREAIESLRWVKHARVQRVWPREIVISVIEREPIALARIDGQIFQVDPEGVILPHDGLTLGDSPILDGLGVDDMEGNRARIEVYRATVDLIGAGLLSEVRITESGEVSVVPSDFPILVDLGLEHHRERWALYLQYSGEIRRVYPGASRVDLRFEGQVIIQPGNDQPARSLTWEEEARLL